MNEKQVSARTEEVNQWESNNDSSYEIHKMSIWVQFLLFPSVFGTEVLFLYSPDHALCTHPFRCQVRIATWYRKLGVSELHCVEHDGCGSRLTVGGWDGLRDSYCHHVHHFLSAAAPKSSTSTIHSVESSDHP